MNILYESESEVISFTDKLQIISLKKDKISTNISVNVLNTLFQGIVRFTFIPERYILAFQQNDLTSIIRFQTIKSAEFNYTDGSVNIMNFKSINSGNDLVILSS